MKPIKLTLLACLVALLSTTGCATPASRTSAATVVADHGAPESLVTTIRRGGRLTLADIENLAVLKVPDQTTIAYLRETGSRYELTLAQIDQMRASGVSPKVIDYLLATPAVYARRYSGYRTRFGFGFPLYNSGHYYGGYRHQGYSHHGGHHR